MKTNLLLGFICVMVQAASLYSESSLKNEAFFLQDHSPKTIFVNSDGTVSKGVISLLKLTNLYDKNDSLKQIVEKTQKAWISVIQGKNNIERTDLKDSEERLKIAKQVELCAEAMGLFQEQPLLLHHYDYGVCHGAFLENVRYRLLQLIQAWNRGIRFDSLIFLTGERYLRNKENEIESISELCNQTKSSLPFKKDWHLQKNASYITEYDMVKIVWEQIEIPQDMAQALKGKIIFVNAPKGIHERPSTKDTFNTWLETHPKPGTILAFSHPLLWAQQQIVGENAIRNTSFALNTAAPAFSQRDRDQYGSAMCSLILDTVAKCLYEIDESSHTK